VLAVCSRFPDIEVDVTEEEVGPFLVALHRRGT
jgi:hypothetical protein